MSKNDLGYDSKNAIPNKLINDNGTITDISGNEVTNAVDAYKSKPAIPNKVLNPDGSYTTLSEIISGGASADIFVVVETLPESGDPNKIYVVPSDNKLLEYHWTGTKWDPIGMLEVDLTDYVKNTDYATNNKGGVVKSSDTYKFELDNGQARSSVVNLMTYNNMHINAMISKGTLENVLTPERAKINANSEKINEYDTEYETKTVTGELINVSDSMNNTAHLVLKGNSDISTTVTGTHTIRISNNGNIFDENDATIIDAYLYTSTLGSLRKEANPNKNRTFIFEGDYNKTYIIHKVQSSRFRVATYSSIVEQGQLNNAIYKDNATDIIISTNSTDKYIYVFFWTDSDTLTQQEVLDSVKIIDITEASTYPIALGNISLVTGDSIQNTNGVWYVVRADSTTEEITDTTLIGQLNSLNENCRTYLGNTTIIDIPTSGTVFELELTYNLSNLLRIKALEAIQDSEEVSY